MWKAFLRYKVHELSNTQNANRCIFGRAPRAIVKHVPQLIQRIQASDRISARSKVLSSMTRWSRQGRISDFCGIDLRVEHQTAPITHPFCIMSEMRPDVLCPACEGKGGSGLFWKRKCALCEDKWYLYTRPHKCSACSGRKMRRENGRVFESVCVLCTGTGWTKRKLTKCAICSNRSALAGFFERSAPPCSACRGAGWVERKQANCILCEGKGQLGAPSARMGVGTAAMGVSAGAAAAGPVGAAVGAWGAAWLLMQHVRECHGCKGVKVQ